MLCLCSGNGAGDADSALRKVAKESLLVRARAAINTVAVEHESLLESEVDVALAESDGGVVVDDRCLFKEKRDFERSRN